MAASRAPPPRPSVSRPRMPTAASADDDSENSELGLSRARRLHQLSARRLPVERTSAMTLSTSTPLRSVTARPLAHISTINSAVDTLANDLRAPPPPPPASLDPLAPPLPPADPLDDASASTSTAVPTAAEDPTLSASMRSFAVIICNDCFYLEFPGCDIHGILYTERAVHSDTTASPVGSRKTLVEPPKVHAKCPKCTAATNNVRPFREGCRRCKAETTVHMWCSTLSEIAHAHDAFASGIEEIAHTALTCESCQSVVFPRAREALTVRTLDHAMTASNGKPLKVSNFQLSMPHVEGCARKGMPLQTVAVQLTKSELKFVLERIEQCPFTARIQGGPQYRTRKHEVVTKQNHAHQIYLRLLSTVVKTYDPLSPNALTPLQKIVGLFDRMEPLTLFHEWSPPRVLSQTQHKPSRVEASSTLDDVHSPECVLLPDASMWRPNTDPTASESLQFHFTPPVAMAAITLQWDLDFRPAKYSVVVATEDGATETVAVVVDGRTQQTVLFAQQTAVTCVRLSVYADADKAIACGLQSALFHEAGLNDHHTPAEVILYDLQQWLLRASLSPVETVRDTALMGLQKLTLACGSLCGLVQLATALILNVASDEASTPQGFDEQEWNRLDRLQLSMHQSTKTFVAQLAKHVLRIMVTSDTPDAGENSLVEKHVLEQMMRAIEEPSARQQNETALSSPPLPPPSPTHLRMPSPKAVCASNEGEQSESPLYPYMTMAACQSAFTDSITRRSQVGMVVLMILSELSAWQMKRMQKAEEYAGRKEEELMQLEEPFSVEVRPQLFDLAHRLLCHVLSTWVAAPTSSDNDPTETKEETKEQDGGDAALRESAFDEEVEGTLAVDLYNMLMRSFGELGAALGDSGYLGSFEQNRRPTFTPDVMCVSILQIITSNIRRLVLSRVDPAEIGIATPTSLGQTDLLSAPPALQPMVTTLEQLIALGTKRSDKFFPLSLKAAAAVEVGMEAFYPSAHQRTSLLRSRMGKGATLEVQVRWPVQERDQEDPRYERLILMLQFECIRMGFTHAIRGRWQFFMHLVVEVPALQDTEDVLHTHFASCIQQAGFSSWQVVAGAQEISINLQRHLHWNRVEKMSHDSGAGWIRVYPRDVARFDDVLGDVDLFLSDHDKRSAAKSAARP